MLAVLPKDHYDFPEASRALTAPNGLLAVGGGLEPERIVAAYQRGIFPWYEAGQPILWWSPDPRMVLFPRELHVSRSLRKAIAKNAPRITADRDFAGVIAGCAGTRPYARGTWITRDMLDAYTRLHELGIAHSVEAWEGSRLVGGLYGVALGKIFYGESMFSRRDNVSKIAFVTLVRQLEIWGYELIDCQVASAYLASFGAREIPRREFQRFLPAARHPAAERASWRDLWTQETASS